MDDAIRRFDIRHGDGGLVASRVGKNDIAAFHGRSQLGTVHGGDFIAVFTGALDCLRQFAGRRSAFDYMVRENTGQVRLASRAEQFVTEIGRASCRERV